MKGCLDCTWFRVKRGGLDKDLEIKDDAKLYCNAMMFDKVFTWKDSNGYSLLDSRRFNKTKMLQGCKVKEVLA